MKLKLIKFQAIRSNEIETCEDCGFESHISRYNLLVEVVSSDKHEVGSQQLIRFEENRYIDKYVVNNKRLWRKFLDQNEVPECESFDKTLWINNLRMKYQDTMKAENDKEIAEHISNLIFGGRN